MEEGGGRSSKEKEDDEMIIRITPCHNETKAHPCALGNEDSGEAAR